MHHLIFKIIFIHFNQLGNNVVGNFVFVEIVQIDFFFFLDENVDDVFASQTHVLVGLNVVQLAHDDVRVPASEVLTALLGGTQLKMKVGSWNLFCNKKITTYEKYKDD